LLSLRAKGVAWSRVWVSAANTEDTNRKLAELTDVTHVFYAAFQSAPGSAANFTSNTGPNREMLVNSVTAIDRAAPSLRRVVLVTGTKYYGVHLGPLKTPMRETDPRHMPPNYYFDQIDWLTAYQRGKEWDWVELRPQTLCGFSPGSPMSILPAIAVYAAISKELDLPLRFPGKPGAYDTIYQVTESTHFANAALWAATNQRCGNEAFNITNGDYFRWRNLWPKIAAVFEMTVADPQTICLTQHIGAHTSMPASVAAIAAMRMASAPFPCIGKFIRERGFGSRPTLRRHPKTVLISLVSIADDTVSSIHRQNGL
jgi:nucleoside-diphosphate-sugar epimerase